MIIGGKSADTLDGKSGDDTLTGGLGADAFTVSSGTDTITDWGVASTTDTLSISSGATAVYNVPTAGGTVLTFSPITNSGKLVVDASASKAVTIVGSTGIDSITGGNGADKITGGLGADTIDAGAGADTLVYLLQNTTGAGGLATQNLFYSSATVDSLAGGDGVDTILIGTTGTAVDITAADVWTGITDVEVIKAAANSAVVTIALDVTAATSGIYKVDLSDVTQATGSIINVSEFTVATDATLIGPSATTSNAVITGGAGADSITAAGGGTTITGGLGADTINGGASDDVLIYALTADLFADSTSVDSIKGGADAYAELSSPTQGDILKVGTAATSGSSPTPAIAFTIANDDSWARITGVETIIAVANNKSVNIALDSSAQGAGIKEVDLRLVTGISTDKSSINVSEFTTGVKLRGASATGIVDITGGLGVDTITGAAGGGTIQGNGGADVITAAAGTDIFVVNSIVGTSSDSAATAATGSAYGTAGDSITSFLPGTDKITVVATNVHNFDANTDAVVGTGSSPSLAAGAVVANFVAATSTAATGLINFNHSESSFGEAGDIALGFTFSSTTLTAANFRTALTYNITGTSATDTINGGENADTINGAGGDDVIIGDNSADTIIGGDGADYIRGDATGNTYSATNTDVIFVGAETTAVGGVYPEGSDNISGTAVNSYFLTLFHPFSTKMSGVFGGANIVCGRQGADTVIASTAKDIMWYQTAGANADPDIGIASDSATLNINGYLSGAYLGADTIHGFTIGEDAIVLTDLYGNTDHIAFGSTAAATAWTSAADIGGYLASTNSRWTWTSTGTGAGTLAYDSANNPPCWYQWYCCRCKQLLFFSCSINPPLPVRDR